MNFDIQVWPLLLRLGHMLGYLIAGGIPLVLLFTVLPTARSLSDDGRAALIAGLHKRMRPLVYLAILLLLATGLVNYLTIERIAHKGQATYHAMMGLKILLALGVFFIASALVGRSEALERFRKRRAFWLGVNLLLVLVIVALGSILRQMPDSRP